MNRKHRRTTGTPFTVWYGTIEEEDKCKARFMVWRGFYNDNLTPFDATMKVRG